MNQRKGRFAMYNRAGDEGVTTPSVSWGANSKMTSPDRSSGAKKLEANGVKVDHWPINPYKTVPLPGWDRTNWDHEKNEPYAPHHPMEFNAASYKKLEDAGVYVQAEPSLDGNTDTTIRYEPVPQYRKSGVARQEKPLYFLLRSHVNMAAPQPVENKKAGYEYADEYSKEGHKPGEYGA